MATMLIERPKVSTISEEDINTKSKKYHHLFLTYDILIEKCDEIKNPALRIRELKNINKIIAKTYRDTNDLLRLIAPGKEGHLTLTTQDELLENLQDLRAYEYEHFKYELTALFKARIRSKLKEAFLDNAFDQTFYVYQDARGNETNKAQSWHQYFLGVPRKDQHKLFYFLDWLSYIGGGFLIIPLKNTLKWVVEFVPNFFMTLIDNNLTQLQYQRNPVPSGLDVLFNFLAYGFFKILHILGRAITSPLTSAKVGFKWGQEICNQLPTDNALVKKITGIGLGILFALPSLAIGMAAIVLSILFVPTSIIWITGKLPVIGVEGVAWLTSLGNTLRGLNGVAKAATTNFSIASAIGPSFATEAGAGISGFTQFFIFGQKILKLLGLGTLIGSKPNPGSGSPPPPAPFENVPYAYRLSYKAMQAKGIAIERIEEEKDIASPSSPIALDDLSLPPSLEFVPMSGNSVGSEGEEEYVGPNRKMS